MACEYWSRVEVERFSDLKTLEKALARPGIDRRRYTINGLTVETTDRAALNSLRQAYSTESAKSALKAKGYQVAEKRVGNKIKLTVQA